MTDRIAELQALVDDPEQHPVIPVWRQNLAALLAIVRAADDYLAALDAWNFPPHELVARRERLDAARRALEE